MAKISKFIKLDKNVLLEYVYNGDNLLGEAYNILVNSRERKRTYVASDSSATGNTNANSLFRIDAISNKYGKVNTSYYTFLENKNFSSGTPIRHDIIRFHLPINWTFGEYLGLYCRVFTYDSLNVSQFEISNFYFDMTDVGQQYLMNFTAPPLLFQEKLWGKNIQIEIPAVSEISSQLDNNRPKENSINSNLTSGGGLSLTAPIFLEFRFIQNIQTINGIVNYQLSTPITTTIPQTPEFEKLGLMIEHSPNGDFFEIYGTYNGTVSGLKKFLDDSVSLGNRYYIQYSITMYEQNTRGKTLTITVNDNFNETIEYRPIIKYSTTTAIIDVEMKLIDAVDDSYIIRKASYGMLQDEVSKYSSNMMKINMKNATKPKIYNMKNAINPDLVGVANSMGMLAVDSFKKKPTFKFRPIRPDAGGILNGTGLVPGTTDGTNPLFNNNGLGPNAGGYGGVGGANGLGGGVGSGAGGVGSGAGGAGAGGVIVEQIKVPFPVLMDRFTIIGRSENALIDSVNFFGYGKIQIVLYPFDNIIKFTIATGDNATPNILNLTPFSEIKLILRNDQSELSFPLYTETREVNLANGQVIFKIPQAKYAEAKKIYQSGTNVFYITGINLNTTSVIYTGLFIPYDDKRNVAQLNIDAGNIKPSIKLDPSTPKETAIVTRKQVTDPTPTTKPNSIKDSQQKGGLTG